LILLLSIYLSISIITFLNISKSHNRGSIKQISSFIFSIISPSKKLEIKSSKSSYLFDRFWRSDPSRARSSGGTGLGLSIALEDAKLHQGHLLAWGQKNNGAHFVLTLPKRHGTAVQTFPIDVIPVDSI